VNDVTQILSWVESGDPAAAQQLLPVVYAELRKLAAARMANEPRGHTLSATDLVHEAYIRLVDVDKAQHFNSRGHFFAAAAEAMRRILVEQARRKRSLRGGGRHVHRRAGLDLLIEPEKADEVLAVDEALEKLARENSPVAQLVQLRYFAGLNLEEAAAAIGVSERTAYRYWAYAKAWLHTEISGNEPP